MCTISLRKILGGVMSANSCCYIATAVCCGCVETGAWPSTLQHHSCSWCTYSSSSHPEVVGGTEVNAGHKYRWKTQET